MIDVLRNGISMFFLYAVAAVFTQNAVFSRALGVSRLVKLVEDPTVDTLIFSGLLCIIQVIAGVLSFFVNKLFGVALSGARFYVRPLLLVICTIAAYLLVSFFIILVYKQNAARRIVDVLPVATFNCCVLGTLLVAVTKNYTLLQTVAFAIGSSVGYVMAVMLVTEGQRTLRNRNIPQSFKGLPATLVYIGILALALYGFTGHMPVF